jgi:endonuclease III
MSVANLITTLISGIRDPATRMDVASTINYLLDLYSSRMITDEEVEESIRDICRDVLTATMIKASKEEINKKIDEFTFEFIKAFKVASLGRRAMSRYRIPMP